MFSKSIIKSGNEVYKAKEVAMDSRFINVSCEGTDDLFRVFADTETGVCYVIHTDVAHNSESMSVLLDETGSPMIDLSAITYVD